MKTELETLQDKPTDALGELLFKLAKAQLDKNRTEEQKVLKELDHVLKTNQGIADLLGRKKTLEDVLKPKKETFSEEVTVENYNVEDLFNVPFEEAANSILDNQLFKRFGGRFYNGILKETASLFGKDAKPKRAFGVLNAREELQNKVNSIVKESIETGKSTDQAVAELKKFTGSYAETVYRTQSAKAYNAGRMRQLEDPHVRTLVGAVQYNSLKDVDTRPDHAALDGFMFSPHDPIAKVLTPPLYYNCRCYLTMITKDELNSRGLLDARGKLKPQGRRNIPKENFGTRKDAKLFDVYKD